LPATHVHELAPQDEKIVPCAGTPYFTHVKMSSDADDALAHEQIIAMDLEGIVCKQKDSPYKVTDKPSRYWIKVKNSRYSQLEGREEGSNERRNLLPLVFAICVSKLGLRLIATGITTQLNKFETFSCLLCRAAI
jgi:ATP dependent DNA ligase domain